jgi:hypothetical protein
MAIGVVPGVAGVFFGDRTTLEQVRHLADSLGLSFKNGPSGTPLNGVHSVPVGTDDEWGAKFKSAIRSVATTVISGQIERFFKCVPGSGHSSCAKGYRCVGDIDVGVRFNRSCFA